MVCLRWLLKEHGSEKVVSSLVREKNKGPMQTESQAGQYPHQRMHFHVSNIME